MIQTHLRISKHEFDNNAQIMQEKCSTYTECDLIHAHNPNTTWSKGSGDLLVHGWLLNRIKHHNLFAE